MADSPPTAIADALKPDGFVDFYQLIGEEPDASIEQVRSRINTLYEEAQANRDHRNLNKRREYQLLLELLPQARHVLLDAGKRARYNTYADEVRRHQASYSFDAFMAQMTHVADQGESERIDVLGVQDTTTRGAATVKPTSSIKSATAQSAAGEASAKPSTSLLGAAIGLIVLMAVFFIAHLVAHQEVLVAAGIAAVAGVITYALVYVCLGARPRT